MEKSINGLNGDDKLRQEIIGITADYKYGGTHQFEKMTLKTFKALLENNFVDLEECYNNAPTHGTFKDFAEKHSGEQVYFHGYIVSPERSDYRLTVEGIESYSTNKDYIIEFSQLFHDADEFECKDGYQRIWYD